MTRILIFSGCCLFWSARFALQCKNIFLDLFWNVRLSLQCVMRGPARYCFFEGCWILSDGDLQTVRRIKNTNMSKACIDRSDSLIFQHKRRPRVTKYKKIFPLKFISAPLKAKHFIGQLWQLMTASNVGARTQAWQAKWAVFKIPGFVCKRFLPFFPTPSPLFYLRHFSRGLWLSFLVLCS